MNLFGCCEGFRGERERRQNHQRISNAGPLKLRIFRNALTCFLIFLTGAFLLQPGVSEAETITYSPVAPVPSWTSLNSLKNSRYMHTSTVLQDGRILVAGGYSNEFLTDTCEIFDPATGEWTDTGTLNASRYGHTATLLRDGRVLVVGGYDGVDYVVAVEAYDPQKNSWAVIGSLSESDVRLFHSATLLQNGDLLMAGGWGWTGPLQTAKVYEVSKDEMVLKKGVDLLAGRFAHTASLLQDGTVLLAGGFGTSYNLSNCEVYDAETGQFDATGALNEARYDHTATVLSDGSVLVAGGAVLGSDGFSPTFLDSYEVYDATSRQWYPGSQYGDKMNAPRYNHSATLLPNGRVMVCGGYGNNDYLASCEVYNPNVTSEPHWSYTESMTTARLCHTATLLTSGQVIVVGGYSNDGALSSVEKYIYAPGAWNETGSMKDALAYHTATLLSDGRVLVTGTSILNDDYVSTCQIYDPAAGSWTGTGGMIYPRRYNCTATLLSDGRVLVTGGYRAPYSCEIYDPATGAWTETGSMKNAREYHTATLLSDGRVLVAGGAHGYGAISTCEIYDPVRGAWTDTGNMKYPRSSHSAILLPDGRVLVTAGYSDNGATSSCETFYLATGADPATGVWTETGNMKYAREYHTATLLPGGRVLVTAGDSDNGATSSCEIFYLATGADPATGVWTETGSMKNARKYHTATLLPGGRVLAAGGAVYSEGAYLSSCEVYDAAPGIWTDTGSLKDARSFHTATLLPNSRVLVAGGEYENADYNTNGSCETYDTGLGFTEGWRPIISNVSFDKTLETLLVEGSNFTGLSEGAFGSNQQSPSNYPMLQLRRLDNEQIKWLLPGTPWSSESFESLALTDFPKGPAMVTVFVNGIPSVAKVITSQEPLMAQAWCAGAQDLGGDWKWFDWFGYFNVGAAPWIYHQQHGWLYIVGDSEDSISAWDSNMQAFWWTSKSVYPSVYRFSDGSWLWYQKDSTNPRLFSNLSSGALEAH